MNQKCRRCPSTHNVRWVDALQDYLCGRHAHDGPKLPYGTWCKKHERDPADAAAALAYDQYRSTPNHGVTA